MPSERIRALLMTNLEGSTATWETHGPSTLAVLAEHEALMQRLAVSHGGRVLKPMGEGDSLFALFDSPAEAIACAVEFVRGLAVLDWGEIKPMRARCAVHSGAVQERDGDCYGQTVNRCARIRSAGHGGQILVSLAAQQMARSANAGFGFSDLGEHRLKDLLHPERIFQVYADGLAAEFPPLRTLGAAAQNLPVQPTAFIGRERELGDVRRLLETARLISLVGPGGSGKTRLGLQSASEAIGEFPGGVRFVPLEAVSSADRIEAAIRGAFDLSRTEGPLAESLHGRTEGRRTLLILDNCEHVLDGVRAVIRSVLRECPDLCTIATSREPFDLPGEVVYTVRPFPVPDPERAEAYELAMSDAVLLFLDLARAANPTMVFEDRQIRSLARICRRLDGIPLALVLAAPRLRAMSPEQLEARLAEPFGLLADARGEVERQRTLRATIEWSYRLLDDDERLVFSRLSAFAGGWTLDAAEEVVGGLDFAPDRVAETLVRLVDRSLIAFDPGTGRQSMLTTIREFADEQRRSRPADPSVARHRAWCLRLAQTADQELQASGQSEWIANLRAEHENILRAVARAFDDPGAAPDAVKLVRAMGRFWYLHEHWDEGLRWVTRARALVEADDPATQAELANLAGVLGWALGRTISARHDLDQAVALFDQLNDVAGAAKARTNLGLIARGEGDHEAAQEYFGRSVAAFRELGDPAREMLALNNLGLSLTDLGRPKEAEAPLRQAYEIAQATGDTLTAAFALNNLGDALSRQERWAEALRCLGESAECFVEHDAEVREADCFLVAAGAVFHLGRADDAARLVGLGGAIRERRGLPEFAAYAPQETVVRDALRAALGEAYNALRREGAALTLRQGLDLMRNISGSPNGAVSLV